VVQLSAPAGEYWKTVDATPEPVSAVAAESVTLPRRFAPGSARVAVGGVLSTRRFETTEEIVVLPARSVAIARRS
jgi:hypothetical protein